MIMLLGFLNETQTILHKEPQFKGESSILKDNKFYNN